MRLAEQVEQTPQGEPPRREMALGLTYLRVVETMADEFCADEDPHEDAPANAVSAGQ